MLVLVVLASIIFLAGGFTLGLATYAHVYQHFRASVELACARRYAAERQRDTINRAILEQTRARLVEQYGPNLSRRQQEIIDEELAAVVTNPRSGNGEA